MVGSRRRIFGVKRGRKRYGRRRVGRRRMRRRRGYRRRRVATPRTLMPQTRVVKMKYVYSATIPEGTWTSNVLNLLPTEFQLKANSIYRPNLDWSGAGNARKAMYPSQFIFYKLMYNQCEVKSSYYKIHVSQGKPEIITNQLGVQNDPMIFGVRANHTGAGPGVTSYEQFNADPLVKYKIMTPNANGTGNCTVRCSWNANKRFGTAQAQLNICNPVTSDPQDVDVYTPFVQFQDYAAVSHYSFNVTVSCTYYVKFSDPKSVNDFSSTAAIEQHA